MAFKVRLTRLAEADAYAAYEYISHQAPRNAEKWLINLFKVIETLEIMPERCLLAPEADELGHPARQLIYGKKSVAYRIIFDIQEHSNEGPRVRVLRIWRGSRNALTSADIDTEVGASD